MLECESEWNALEKSGFKISLAIANGLDVGAFQRCRNRFRTIYERFLVEEPEFFVKNLLFAKFWSDCYAKHIDELQSAIKEQQKSMPVALSNLQQFLRLLVFEGVSLLSLLLRRHSTCNNAAQVRFEILLLLAQLKHLQGSSNSSSQEQSLLQEAIKLFPEDGRATFLMSKFAQSDGDVLLSLFWCLSALAAKKPAGEDAWSLLKTLANHICERPGASFYSPSRLKYMKAAKRAALDSTLLAISPVLQLLVHGISNQLGSKSHFKHLDQFAHARLAQLNAQDLIDFDVIERILEAFWMVLLNSRLFSGGENLILPQAVMLAGLFRFMRKYRLGGVIEGIRLFSGKNYEIACKIYPFFAECLHEYLESLPVESIPFTEALVEAGLLVLEDGKFLVRPVLERSNRLHRSMKVLTHRLLEARVHELASPVEVAERLGQRPWKIVDFQGLLRKWNEIRTDCQQNRERYLITCALLDQLDVAKQADAQVREIIRFIHTAVTANNPSLRLQSVREQSSALRISREEFKAIEKEAALVAFEGGGAFTWKALVRFWCEHLKAVRYFLSREEAVENCCENFLFKQSR